MKFYRCAKCGNITVKLVDAGPPLSCCGELVAELKAGVTDAAKEKHVPALSQEGNTLTVQVGSVAHPMLPEHYIQLIAVEQQGKVQYITLAPDQEPKAVFQVEAGKSVTVYEYCNLHGLWKAEQK